jgi:hypothetical protein
MMQNYGYFEMQIPFEMVRTRESSRANVASHPNLG